MLNWTWSYSYALTFDTAVFYFMGTNYISRFKTKSPNFAKFTITYYRCTSCHREIFEKVRQKIDISYFSVFFTFSIYYSNNAVRKWWKLLRSFVLQRKTVSVLLTIKQRIGPWRSIKRPVQNTISLRLKYYFHMESPWNKTAFSIREGAYQFGFLQQIPNVGLNIDV